MTEHQERAVVEAPADALFAYLSEVGNLPDYFSRMTSAQPAGGDSVRTTAVVQGREVEGEAWFQVDSEARRIQWGSEGPNDYQGWLEVEATQDGRRSEVIVHISTERAANGEIDAALLETLAQIKRNVEGTNPRT